MQRYWEELIERALQEDVGPGDHSSNCAIPAETRGAMQLWIKEAGVLAGLKVAQAVFAAVDQDIRFEALAEDGTAVKAGQVVLHVDGRVRSLLQAERLALNFMQRMSGIASYARRLTEMIAHTSCRLLDTRKTTPGLRRMEKEAVRLGGGYNHRMGLYDMIMLKDNHLDFAGGIAAAVEKARAYQQTEGLNLPIEVETRNLQEVEEVLACPGVQRVMFDNFSAEQCREGVVLVGGRLETEASGGIDERSLVAYAESGVDFISMGALTHSVKSLDMSLKAL